MFDFYVRVVAADEDNYWKETLCGGVTEVNVATATKIYLLWQSCNCNAICYLSDMDRKARTLAVCSQLRTINQNIK